MTENPLRAAFREIARDPALLLIEIAWRWTFGIIAAIGIILAIAALLGSVSVDQQRLQALIAMSPTELLQTVAAGLASLGLALFRVTVICGFVLACVWIVLHAAGRHATLARSALAPGASFANCFALATLRVLVAFVCIGTWMLAGMLAGLLGMVNSQPGSPNFALMSAVLIPTFFILLAVWSVANWYLGIAPLFRGLTWRDSIAQSWRFARTKRDALLQVSIANGVTRGIWLAIALSLWVAVSAVVKSPELLIADFLMIALLYFLVADYLYLAKLAAYARLRDAAVIDAGPAL